MGRALAIISTTAGRREAPRDRQRGFSLIELMVGLTVLLIGITGILAMQMTALHASGYSRRATEASVLAGDRMEALRTIPAANIVSRLAPGERVNALGVLDAQGLYERTWVVTNNPDGTIGVVVTVSWMERGTELHAINLRGLRR